MTLPNNLRGLMFGHAFDKSLKTHDLAKQSADFDFQPKGQPKFGTRDLA